MQLYFLQFACKKRNTASVKTDADAIGRLAAEHLIRHRFANFAFCGYRRVVFSDRRRNAFAAATRLSPSAWRERSVKNA